MLHCQTVKKCAIIIIIIIIVCLLFCIPTAIILRFMRLIFLCCIVAIGRCAVIIISELLDKIRGCSLARLFRSLYPVPGPSTRYPRRLPKLLRVMTLGLGISMLNCLNLHYKSYLVLLSHSLLLRFRWIVKQ